MNLKPVALTLCFCVCAGAAFAGPTGLNNIPTTDIVPLNSWIGSLQNSNTRLTDNAFYSSPMLLAQTEFALSTKVEAGADQVFLQARNANELVFNIKTTLQSEDSIRPNVAAGIEGIGNHLVPSAYLTLSKTINWDQEQRERYRAHHRRNRKLLGRRVHAGLIVDAHGTAEPFLGTDLQLSDTAVFQADWINGAGNAISFGVANILADQRTVVTPALLFSNTTHRVDGLFINFSHQFNL